MKYLYFSQHEGKFYAGDEEGVRHEMPEADWRAIIQAANVPVPVKDNERVKLQFKEEIKVEIYEGDELIRTANLTPDITEI